MLKKLIEIVLTKEVFVIYFKKVMFYKCSITFGEQYKKTGMLLTKLSVTVAIVSLPAITLLLLTASHPIIRLYSTFIFCSGKITNAVTVCAGGTMYSILTYSTLFYFKYNSMWKIIH